MAKKSINRTIINFWNKTIRTFLKQQEMESVMIHNKDNCTFQLYRMSIELLNIVTLVYSNFWTQ